MSTESRRLHLEELLVDAAAAMEVWHGDGIRLAFDLSGASTARLAEAGKASSAECRAQFAAHHGRSAEGVRKRRDGAPSYEDGEFALLAKALLATSPSQAPVEAAATGPLSGGSIMRSLRAAGDVAEAGGRWDEAAQASVAIVALVRHRAETHPGDHETHLAVEYVRSGMALAMATHPIQAGDAFRRAQRILETVTALNPGDATAAGWLATSLAMEVLLFQARLSDEADASLGRAADIVQRLIERDVAHDSDRVLLVECLLSRTGNHILAGRGQQAESEINRALGLLRDLSASGEFELERQLGLARAFTELGRLRLSEDRDAEAVEALEQALEVLDSSRSGMAAEGPAFLSLSRSGADLLAAQACHLLGIAYVCVDRGDDAEASFERAVDLLDSLMPESPVGAAPPPSLLVGATSLRAAALTFLGFIYVEGARVPDAMRVLGRAVAEFDNLDAADPNRDAAWEMLVEALDALADLQQNSGNAVEADELRARCHAIRRDRSE